MLSRNFGHQGAIFCGLDEFNEDAVLIIDSDFQDNPKYLPELIKEWESGNDIVLANELVEKNQFLENYLLICTLKIQIDSRKFLYQKCRTLFFIR